MAPLRLSCRPAKVTFKLKVLPWIAPAAGRTLRMMLPLVLETLAVNVWLPPAKTAGPFNVATSVAGTEMLPWSTVTEAPRGGTSSGRPGSCQAIHATPGVGVDVGVRVGVAVGVRVGVGVWVGVGVRVRVAVGVRVGVRVPVGVEERVGVRVGVDVGPGVPVTIWKFAPVLFGGALKMRLAGTDV